jgi:hypothetical protein
MYFFLKEYQVRVYFKMANRVLLGKRGSSDFGLYVSRPTEDVTSTSSGLIFNSDSAVKGFNVAAHGQGILNGGASRTISHGLGFRPFVEVTYTNETNMIGAPPTTAATFSVTATYNYFFNSWMVTSVSVTSGGSGYTTAPLVVFSPGGATATATISGGSVTSVTVTSGGFYANSSVTAAPSGGGPPAYASKVYKAYNADINPYTGGNLASGVNIFYDVFQLVNQPGQGDEEWDLDYDEGAYYETTTTNLTITNQCSGGRYQQYSGGSQIINEFYASQPIYYSYIIFNCESPFI